MNLQSKKERQLGSPDHHEDPIGRAQMIWSLLVALTVGFVLFQKNSKAPTQEVWTIHTPEIEKNPSVEYHPPNPIN